MGRTIRLQKKQKAVRTHTVNYTQSEMTQHINVISDLHKRMMTVHVKTERAKKKLLGQEIKKI